MFKTFIWAIILPNIQPEKRFNSISDCNSQNFLFEYSYPLNALSHLRSANCHLLKPKFGFQKVTVNVLKF